MDTMSCYTLSLIFLHTQTLCPLRIPFAFHLGLIFFVYSKYADDMKETLSVDQKGPDVAYAMVISKYLHQKEQILDAKVSPAAFHLFFCTFSCFRLCYLPQYPNIGNAPMSQQKHQKICVHGFYIEHDM